MATGALDANGIWQYGEDDSEPTFSGLLNKLGNSVSSTVTRLEELSGLTAAQLTTHRDNLGVGLVNIVPTSVAQAGGSASANAQGEVTFTGVTSLSLNGVFSASYTNYKVIFTATGTSNGAGLNMRARTAGVDRTNSTYQHAGHQVRETGSTSYWTGSNIQQWEISKASLGLSSSSMDFIAPYVSTRQTGITSMAWGTDATSGVSIILAGRNTTTETQDGFTLYVTAGTITGVIQVFGYNS